MVSYIILFHILYHILYYHNVNPTIMYFASTCKLRKNKDNKIISEKSVFFYFVSYCTPQLQSDPSKLAQQILFLLLLFLIILIIFWLLH
jgi:hypothetical protein